MVFKILYTCPEKNRFKYFASLVGHENEKVKCLLPGPLSPFSVHRFGDLVGLDDALALHAPLVGAARGPVGPGHVLGSTPVGLTFGGGAPKTFAGWLEMLTVCTL